jgi:hypothetical protein
MLVRLNLARLPLARLTRLGRLFVAAAATTAAAATATTAAASTATTAAASTAAITADYAAVGNAAAAGSEFGVAADPLAATAHIVGFAVAASAVTVAAAPRSDVIFTIIAPTINQGRCSYSYILGYNQGRYSRIRQPASRDEAGSRRASGYSGYSCSQPSQL